MSENEAQDPPETPSETGDARTVAQIACDACRRCHRKCTYCADRNKNCTYSEQIQKVQKIVKPSKRNTSIVANTSKKYIAYPSIKEDELARQSTVINHISACVDDMYYFFPVLEIERVKSIVSYIRDVMNTGAPLSPTDYKPEQGELALVFATQGKKHISRVLYQKTREILLPVFDDVANNFEVAACYVILGDYLINSGECKRALFFLRNAQKFIATAEDAPRYHVLKHALLYYTQIAEFSDDVFDRVAYLVRIAISNGVLEENCDRRDYNIASIAVNHVCMRMEQNYAMPPQILQVNQMSLKCILLAVKLRLQRYHELPYDEECLATANQISDCVNDELFPMCDSVVSVCLLEAIYVHEKLFQDSPTREIIERLKLDLKGMDLQIERHDFVKIRLSDALTRARELLALNDVVGTAIEDLMILGTAE